MEIKAIETEYKGYRFRSRLEARWAVFFDAMGVKWEYEPEGFENRNGERYLPDFYLPSFDIWCEVKPSDKSRESEVKKAISFVTDDLKIRALVFLPNIPETTRDNSVFWFICAYYNPLLKEPHLVRAPFACFDGDGNEKMYIPFDYYVGNTIPGYIGGKVEWDAVHDFDMPYEVNAITGRKWWWSEDRKTTKLDFAYEKARQARFEHGEKP